MIHPPHFCPNPHLTAKMLAASLSLALLAGCASVPPLGVNRVRAQTVVRADLPSSLDGYRIAFVSDIHFGNNFSRARLERLIDSINAEKPDCILLGGDDTLGYRQIAEFAEAASRFQAPEGVYAVLGNHDFYNGRQRSIETLRAAGIIVLDESALQTPRGLTVCGINDFTDIFPVMNKLTDILDKNDFTVLVSHNPDFAEKADLSCFDLMLSGHTHGGQITLFGYAPVLPSEYGQKYRTGTVYKDGIPVIVSNGAGFGGTLLRFRFCAPSDFLLITLHSTAPRSDR